MTLNALNLPLLICATPATSGTKVRMKGMNRARTMVTPPRVPEEGSPLGWGHPSVLR